MIWQWSKALKWMDQSFFLDNKWMSVCLLTLCSIWKGSCHPSMIQHPFQSIFKHCLVTSSESVSINWRGVWFILLFKGIPEFPLERRSNPCFDDDDTPDEIEAPLLLEMDSIWVSYTYVRVPANVFFNVLAKCSITYHIWRTYQTHQKLQESMTHIYQDDKLKKGRSLCSSICRRSLDSQVKVFSFPFPFLHVRVKRNLYWTCYFVF